MCSVFRDGIVDKIEFAGSIINFTVRQAKPDFHRVETALVADIAGAAR